MTINGHSYTTGEIGFYQFPYVIPDWDGIYGLANGTSLHNETDDFEIRWYRDSLTPFDFIYTSAGINGTFDSAVYNPVSFTSFTITAVPEETKTIVLLGICIIGLA